MAIGRRQVVTTASAARPRGHYSQGVIVDGMLYTQGVLPLDPASGRLLTGEAFYQTRRALQNLNAICEAAGTSAASAARVTIYARDLDMASEIERAYDEFFGDEPPARTLIGVSELPLGPMSGIEMDAIVPVPRRGQ